MMLKGKGVNFVKRTAGVKEGLIGINLYEGEE